MNTRNSIRVGRVQCSLGSALSQAGMTGTISHPNGDARAVSSFTLNNVREVRDLIYALRWIEQQMDERSPIKGLG